MQTLRFKVTDEEARHIQGEARRLELSLNDYLRRRVIGTDAGFATFGTVKCQHTGALIFAPLPDAPPLTSAAVREFHVHIS